MGKYILNINEYTFIWRKNNIGLVYNTKNYKSFTFSNQGLVKSVCDKLDILDNLYTVIVDHTYSADKLFKEWINNLTSINSASLSLYIDEENKSVSLKPVLRIQNDIESIIGKKSYREIIDCLYELTIHLSGLDIELYKNDYFKQFPYPTSNKSILNYHDLSRFLRYIPNKKNVCLNFIGDFISYPNIEKIIDTLNARDNNVNFYFILDDICEKLNIYNPLIFKHNSIVLCDIENNMIDKITYLENTNLNIKYKFILKDENDFDILKNVLPLLSSSYDIIPVYTKDNYDFFVENVFLNSSDLKKIKLNKRNIFANQALNTNFFGKLEILPDGSIWDNLNLNKIGKIEDDFWKLALRFFNEKGAWFYNRKQEPCSNCLYQWLCPSPSNYELVTGKTNLCHVEL